jgi:hypothetical protein
MSDPPQPPRRDKFAALAQHQQDKQKEAESPSRLQAVALSTEASTTPEVLAVQPTTPVKGDTLAAMSANQVAAASKRDKFASMAAQRSGGTPPTNTAPTTAAATASMDDNAVASGPVVTSTPPPRRDKLSAMASRQQEAAGALASTTDNSSSVTTAVADTTTTTTTNTTTNTNTMALDDQTAQDASAVQTAALQQRMDQRAAVWSDLGRAEAQTIQLLQTAQTTAAHLAAASSSSSTNTTANNSSSSSDAHNNDPDRPSRPQEAALRRCMTDYQTTVEKIHALLAPHAALVKAYQAPVRINRMYQARVELRLAEEKRQLLSEFLRLQQEEITTSTTVTTVAGGGRGGAAGAAGTAMEIQLLEPESSKRKRQDE